MARDFCGKNGCYDLRYFKGDSEHTFIEIFLNSARIVEGLPDGTNTTDPAKRLCPDMTIDYQHQDGDLYLHEITIASPNRGICSYARIILDSEEIWYEVDDVITLVKSLLVRDKTLWGIFPDEDEDDEE